MSLKRGLARKTPLPWQLPVLTHSEIVAIQQLEQGAADQYQQRVAWACIREKLCGAEIMSFWPGEDGRRATDFHEGKRWVALQLRRISRLKPAGVDERGAPPAMPGEAEE